MGSASNCNDTLLDVQAKTTALKVSSCVVSIIVPYKHDQIPEDGHKGHSHVLYNREDDPDLAFGITGVIVESEQQDDGTHMGYILTLATPFLRKNEVQDEIEVEVHLSKTLYQGKVLGRDFHYNLAVVRILSDTPLQTAKLKSLQDIITIDPADHPHPREETSWLRPHSNLFKILPGDRIIVIRRAFYHPHSMNIYRGAYSLERPQGALEECCCISGIEKKSTVDGGTVFNYSGEVIGIMLDNTNFFPVNMVSRWWKHYRSCGDFRRPWIGCEVYNLPGASMKFLEKFIQKFPNTTTGVVVEKVVENSHAHCSGIRRGDVIVAGDDKLVRNTLEFYEKIWDKVGASVKFEVLRANDGSRFEATTMISEVTEDKFHRWRLATVFEKLSNDPNGITAQFKAAMRRCKRRRQG